MSIADPRETYDDLVTTADRERLPPDEFEAHSNSEATAVGWVAIACVLDESDRILLVDEPWAEGWKAPAGAPKPGESLTNAVVREVREETGVAVTPIRPHAIYEFTMVDDRTGETDEWTGAVFEARAESTATDSDLGLENEEISDADWFDSPPTDLYHPLTEQVYRRSVGDRPICDE